MRNCSFAAENYDVTGSTMAAACQLEINRFRERKFTSWPSGNITSDDTLQSRPNRATIERGVASEFTDVTSSRAREERTDSA